MAETKHGAYVGSKMDRRSWEKSLLIFKNTVLMIQWSFPQRPFVDLSKENMDKLYEFVLGRDCTQTPLTTAIVKGMHGRKLNAQFEKESRLRLQWQNA